MSRTREQLIETLNDAFSEVLAEEQLPEYKRFIRKTTSTIIDNMPMSRQEISRIINRAPMNMQRSVEMFMLLNSIVSVLNNARTDRRDLIAPAAALVGMYSVTRPKSFAKRMVKLDKGYKLSKREKQAQQHLKTFKKQVSQDVIDRTNQAAVKNAKRAHIKGASNIYSDFNKMKDKDIKLGDIKKKLTQDYQNKKRVERAVDTEIHETAELSKQEHAKEMGFTRKRWKTVGDERVRSTSWHSQVSGQVMPIGEDFQVGSMRAAHPSDVRLPVGERINCRCYLVYE